MQLLIQKRRVHILNWENEKAVMEITIKRANSMPVEDQLETLISPIMAAQAITQTHISMITCQIPPEALNNAAPQGH